MGNSRYKNCFKVTVHKDLFSRPLEWKKSKLIFVNSMSDIFHEEIPDDIILELFSVMNKANWHTFQVLTKRVNRMMELASRIKWTDNIWMGVTVEDKGCIYRCEELKKTNAAIKFVSAEPLLESIIDIDLNGIDWLIVGGESGHGFRPIQEEWVLDLLRKSRESNTSFFFKQWGGFPKSKNGSLLGGKEYKEYPN